MFSLLSIISWWCVTFEEGFCDIYLNLLPRQICVTNGKKVFPQLIFQTQNNTKTIAVKSSDWNSRNFKLIKFLCQLNLNPTSPLIHYGTTQLRPETLHYTYHEFISQLNINAEQTHPNHFYYIFVVWHLWAQIAVDS